MLLLTGASGELGGLLVDRFLREQVALCLLTHHKEPRRVSENEVEICHGDITRPRLGLSAAVHRRLLGRVTAILHCAATTSFSASEAEADRVNVMGTKHVIAFARACGKLQKVGVLSTVYVAGRRKGAILERDLIHRAGFVNAYERSKYRMEQYLRKQHSLPIAVYRLSTILGDAGTGRVSKLNAVHHALRLYHRGLVSMIPGEPRSTVDLISSDYAAEAVFHLFYRRFGAGKTYHIVAGQKQSLTLENFLETTAATFERLDPRWTSRAVAVPPIVSLNTYRLMEQAVLESRNSVLGNVVRMMGTFAPHLAYSKDFSDRNTARALSGSGIRPRPLQEYYSGIIRDCLSTSWGSRN